MELIQNLKNELARLNLLIQYLNIKHEQRCPEASPGDILYGANNLNIQSSRPHYIIYLSESPDYSDRFYGGMLTHSAGHGNISLEKRAFRRIQRRW